MRVRVTGGSLLLIGSVLAFSLPLAAQSVAATATTKTTHKPTTSTHLIAATSPAHRSATVQSLVWHPSVPGRPNYGRLASGRLLPTRGHVYASWGGISCVPYARNASGIDVAGNAWQWWDNAAGRYARGSRPEPGSVLSFTSNGRMRMGHVAVVSRVINPREIEVDQANWWGPGMHGGISHGMPVVDVSENNDWTAVRVGLGQSGDFGSVYPTNGFIYNRPDDGAMLAAVSTPAPRPVLNPAPADLRSYAQKADYSPGFEEVAEAPATHTVTRHHITHHTHQAVLH
jgi:hypothetical protein